MTILKAGEASRIGQVRPENQDNLVVAVEQQLFAVADGMGGHRGGEVASEVAAETLRAEFVDRTTEGLAKAVQASNEAVVTTAHGDSALKGMGTTMCAMALVEVDGEERLAVANVGDSRLYLLKATTDQLIQITEDHSLVETLYRQGQLTRAEAEAHPHRNILTRALGIDADVLVDVFELQPIPGDRYLICSDGLFNEVDEEHMAIVLGQHGDPRQAADELARLADESGGRDNITVVVVDVVPEAGQDSDPVDPGVDRVVKVDRANEQPIDFPPVSAGSGGNDANAPEREPAPPLPPSPPGEMPTAPQPMVLGPAGQPVPAEPDHAEPAPASASRQAGSASTMAPSSVGVDPSPGAPNRPAPPSSATTVRSQPRTRFTWRVALFIALFIAIFGAVFVAIYYYGTNGYYVGVQADEVTIFQGEPGGLLFIAPKTVESTQIRLAEVPPEFQQDVTLGFKVGSRQEAEKYVQRIRERQQEIRQSLGDRSEGGPTTSTTVSGSATTNLSPDTSVPAAPDSTSASLPGGIVGPARLRHGVGGAPLQRSPLAIR